MKSIKHNRPALLLTGLFLLSIVSCDTFSEFEIPREPDRLVLNGMFEANKPLQLEVGRSIFILDTSYDRSMNNARITLYENGSIASQFELLVDPEWPDFRSSIFNSSTGFRPLAGHSYELEVEAEGFETIISSTTIPPPVEVLGSSFEQREIVLENNETGYPASVTFIDPKGGANFYQIEVIFSYRVIHDLPIELDSIGAWVGIAPRVQSSQQISERFFKNRIFLEDRAFDGETFTFNFVVDANVAYSIHILEAPRDFEHVDGKLSFLVKHITEEQYKYGTTEVLQEELGGDAFSEPVPIFTNIENGLGIFAGYSVSAGIINLQE